jgi:hypothetical protein
MTAERTESEGFFEMLWDCDHCSAKGLLGKSQRHCPECGAPQSAIKRYFPTPEQQQRIEGHSYVGADRHCPACDAPMSAKGKNCTQCGSPLDGSKEVEGVAAPAAAVPVKPKRRIWPWVVGGLLVLGAAIWFLFIRTRSAEVGIAAHRWERTIAIEQFGSQSLEAWRNELPPDAEVPLCHKKQRTTRQVEDGEECHTERHDKKDGTFEQVKKCKPKYRSEPVEDDWCTFTARRWKKIDEVKVSGTGLTPTWPTQGLPAADTPAAFGAKRQGPRGEKLYLDFTNKQSCDVPEAAWHTYSDGQKVKVEVRARSGDLVCSSL